MITIKKMVPTIKEIKDDTNGEITYVLNRELTAV
jgi:hypothetical protein